MKITEAQLRNTVRRLIREQGSSSRTARDGSRHWHQNGRRHRIDGPAVIAANGDKYWYQNDRLHRLDGPAIEFINGNKEWFLNGQRHRSDGPAIEYADGYEEWWLNNEYYPTQTTFQQAIVNDNPR